MRIGYVVDRFPRASHGFVYQEIRELEDRSIEVHVFSLGRPDASIAGTATALARLRTRVNFFPGTFRPDSIERDSSVDTMTESQARWIARQVVAKRLEHLHAHSALGPTDVVREVRRLSGAGYSFTAHSNGLYDGRDIPVLCGKIREAEFVITLMEVDRWRLIEACGPDVIQKIHCVHIGVDVEDSRFSQAECHDADSVLAVGPRGGKQGVADIVEAVRLLRDRGRRVCLTVASDGECDQELRDQVDSLELGDRVRLLGGLSADEIDKLMRAHAVLALPWVAGDVDRDEVASLVLQAMAVGLVVISTDLPGIHELITDGMTGRIISPRDPVWLAGALETLLDNSTLRERMAAHARRKVEREFAVSRNVLRLMRLFAGSVVERRMATT